MKITEYANVAFVEARRTIIKKRFLYEIDITFLQSYCIYAILEYPIDIEE